MAIEWSFVNGVRVGILHEFCFVGTFLFGPWHQRLLTMAVVLDGPAEPSPAFFAFAAIRVILVSKA